MLDDLIILFKGREALAGAIPKRGAEGRPIVWNLLRRSRFHEEDASWRIEDVLFFSEVGCCLMLVKNGVWGK